MYSGEQRFKLSWRMRVKFADKNCNKGKDREESSRKLTLSVLSWKDSGEGTYPSLQGGYRRSVPRPNYWIQLGKRPLTTHWASVPCPYFGKCPLTKFLNSIGQASLDHTLASVLWQHIGQASLDRTFTSVPSPNSWIQLGKRPLSILWQASLD